MNNLVIRVLIAIIVMVVLVQMIIVVSPFLALLIILALGWYVSSPNSDKDDSDP